MDKGQKEGGIFSFYLAHENILLNLFGSVWIKADFLLWKKLV